VPPRLEATSGDVRRFLLKNSTVKGRKAKDCMTKKPKTVLVSASLKEVIDIMEKFKVTTLFVVDSNKNPVGIIHIHNIVGHYIA